MTDSFLGSGWTFPIAINDRGGITLSSEAHKIRESIRIILSTAKGERVMLPEFGCDLQDFVFSAINTATVTMIKSTVEEGLIRWEPRIEVLGIDVSAERMHEGILTIQVHYKVRATNTEHNLVYPFYLKPGG